MSAYQEGIEARRQAEENFQNAWATFSDKSNPMSDNLIDTLLEGQLGRVRTILPFNEETRAYRDRLTRALNLQEPQRRELRLGLLDEQKTELDMILSQPNKDPQYALYSERSLAIYRARQFMSPESGSWGWGSVTRNIGRFSLTRLFSNLNLPFMPVRHN